MTTARSVSHAVALEREIEAARRASDDALVRTLRLLDRLEVTAIYGLTLADLRDRLLQGRYAAQLVRHFLLTTDYDRAFHPLSQRLPCRMGGSRPFEVAAGRDDSTERKTA